MRLDSGVANLVCRLKTHEHPAVRVLKEELNSMAGSIVFASVLVPGVSSSVPELPLPTTGHSLTGRRTQFTGLDLF